MGNLSTVKAYEILPEFQKFLLEKKLAPEKNIFFYALWISKFFKIPVPERSLLHLPFPVYEVL